MLFRSISRSGASSLTELAHMGKAALLVPYPFAADDHQAHNARVFAAHGAARMMRENTLTSDDIAAFLNEVLKDSSLLASMSRDKEGMLRVLGAVRAFAQVLPQLSEEALFACGADALRLTVDLYRRTGQPFLLNLLETMRGQLPDVSGLMHMFPFQREYRRESQGNTPEEKAFYDRMDRFAMGKGAAAHKLA